MLFNRSPQHFDFKTYKSADLSVIRRLLVDLNTMATFERNDGIRYKRNIILITNTSSYQGVENCEDDANGVSHEAKDVFVENRTVEQIINCITRVSSPKLVAEALSSSAFATCAHSLSSIEGDIVYRFLIIKLRGNSHHVCNDIMEQIKLFTTHKQEGINLIIFATDMSNLAKDETAFLNIMKSFRKEVSEISALVIVDSSQSNLKGSEILNFVKLGVYDEHGMREDLRTRVSKSFESLYFMQLFDKTEGSAFNEWHLGHK